MPLAEAHTCDPVCLAVVRCEPEIEDMGELLKTLNETGNFSQFVRTVRRHFSQLVS